MCNISSENASLSHLRMLSLEAYSQHLLWVIQSSTSCLSFSAERRRICVVRILYLYYFKVGSTVFYVFLALFISHSSSDSNDFFYFFLIFLFIYFYYDYYYYYYFFLHKSTDVTQGQMRATQLTQVANSLFAEVRPV